MSDFYNDFYDEEDEYSENLEYDIEDDDEDYANELCIKVATAGKENKFAWKVDKLRRSIKALKEEIPALQSEKFSAYKDELELCELIIKNVFPEDMGEISVFCRNLSYDNDTNKTIRFVGLRPDRNPEEDDDYEDDDYEDDDADDMETETASDDNYDDYEDDDYENPDWLLTELQLDHSYNLLFTGSLNSEGSVFNLEDISLIAEPQEKLDYEENFYIEFKKEPYQVSETHIEDIFEYQDSLYETTEKRLQEWNGYLNWQSRLTNLRIKGCKYIGIQYLENDKRRKDQLIFVLAAHNPAVFDDVIRYIRRGNVNIYNNSISKNDWIFDYIFSNKDNGEKITRGKIESYDIGQCMGIVDRFTLSDVKNKLDDILVPNKSKKDKKDTAETNIIDYDSLKHIYGDNPAFLRIAYKINSDDENRIKDDDDITDIPAFIKNEVIPQYPANGYVACREVGTFALIKRERDAIFRLKSGESFSPHINEWLFDVTKARKTTVIPEITKWKNPDIGNNPNQKLAIEKMLAAKDLFLLQGPPGTGKTTVIAEAIYQFAIKGKRVLLASQSNDAVDNALEDLAQTPEIRAIRVDPRKIKNISDKNEEEAAEKLSEDTALSFYFKSIGKQIDTEQYEWKKIDENSDILAKEQQIIKFYNLDIAELNKDYSDLQTKESELKNALEICNRNLNEANKNNENLNAEEINFKYLENSIKGEPKEFYLSERQLNLITPEVSSLLKASAEKGIILSKSYSENSENHNKNISLQILFANYRTLRNLYEVLKTAKASDSNSVNPMLEKINQEINAITEKLNNCSEDEITQLVSELNKKKSERIKLSGNQNNSFNLTVTQKEILSDELKSLIQKDPVAACKQIGEAGNAVVSSINKITSILKENLSGGRIDTSKLIEQYKVLDGQQKSVILEKENIEKKIKEKKGLINNLVQKYNITGNNDIEIADNLTAVINKKINENLSLQQTILKKQKDWGVSLAKYSKMLEEHSQKKDFIELENQHYKDHFFKTCNVVGITCTADPGALKAKGFIDDFDVVIIDEVSKATPPELLLSLLKARKTVLVGDHRQLPPAFGENEASYQEQVEEIQSSEEYSEAEKREITMENFKKYEHMVTSSIFKEHFDRADDSIKETLTTQYRMHPHIMNIINEFYEGRLKCGIKDFENARNHELTIPAVDGSPFILPQRHAYWIDSSKLPDGNPFYESKIGTGTSTCNFLEEELTFELLRKIAHEYRQLGYPKKVIDPETHKEYEKKISVGVISFYMLSKKNLQNGIKALRNGKDTKEDFKALKISVNTVDRFQGQQKDIIISTLVRNWKPNERHRITSFIAAYERINVAFSRARNLLFIIGANDLFEKVPVELSSFEINPETGKNRIKTVNVYRDIVSKLSYNSGTTKGFFDSGAVLTKEAAASLKQKHLENENDRREQRRGNK